MNSVKVNEIEENLCHTFTYTYTQIAKKSYMRKTSNTLSLLGIEIVTSLRCTFLLRQFETP